MKLIVTILRRLAAAAAGRPSTLPRPDDERRRAGLRAGDRTTIALALAGAISVSWAQPATADEDDWQVAARAGIAGVVVDGRDPLGVRVGLDGQYDISDAWAVRLSVNGSRHGVSEDRKMGLPGGAIWGYGAFGGLSYTMDVLRLLPSFEVGVGMLGVTGAVVAPRRAIGMKAAIAADYLLGPRFSVGGVAEYVYAPFDLISNALNGSAVPQAFALSIRTCWIIH